MTNRNDYIRAMLEKGCPVCSAELNDHNEADGDNHEYWNYDCDASIYKDDRDDAYENYSVEVGCGYITLTSLNRLFLRPTDMRDMDDAPYIPDEKRVVDYILQLTNDQIGGGNDPIGFLIASHGALAEKVKDMERQLREAQLDKNSETT